MDIYEYRHEAFTQVFYAGDGSHWFSAYWDANCVFL